MLPLLQVRCRAQPTRRGKGLLPVRTPSPHTEGICRRFGEIAIVFLSWVQAHQPDVLMRDRPQIDRSLPKPGPSLRPQRFGYKRVTTLISVLALPGPGFPVPVKRFQFVVCLGAWPGLAWPSLCRNKGVLANGCDSSTCVDDAYFISMVLEQASSRTSLRHSTAIPVQ